MLGHADPMGHVVQVMESPPSENVPFKHGRGTPEPHAYPAGHDEQAVARASENVDVGHGCSEVVFTQNEPTGQAWHWVTLPPKDTLPTSQGVGLAEGSAHANPGGQLEQTMAPERAKLPGLQATGGKLAFAHAKPAAHDVHTVAAGAEKNPAPHGI